MADSSLAQILHAFHEPKPTEVLVFGEEDSILLQCKLHQIPVHGVFLKFAHGEYLMPVRPKNANHGEVAALIRKETHRED